MNVAIQILGGLFALATLFTGQVPPSSSTPPSATSLAAPQPPSAVTAEVGTHEPPRVQLALLLDTSSSMSGLINQAKAQLWRVVNELATTKRGDERPLLQVALYEYGNSGLEQEAGWVRLVSPLTDDLDRISEALFALRTGGGAEYCGHVIQRSLDELQWSANPNDLKLIYIAGNEPFTQGPTDYVAAGKAALSKGIIVNTIHCGSYEVGVNRKWQHGAQLAEGAYMHIDHNRALAHVEAPQDAEIARLSAEINTTYVPYGAAGATGSARQAAQDSNAASMAVESAVQRAAFKSSGRYLNTAWDLVDALREGTVSLNELSPDDLPKALREMSDEERKAHIDKKREQRASLQSQLKTLFAARERFVAEKRRELEDDGGDSLDTAMLRSLREQASRKAFVFEPAE